MQNQKHKHNWKYNATYQQWQCQDCDELCDIYCMICLVPIPRKQIPKEALEKIGGMIYWHEKCVEAEMQPRFDKEEES